jgi:sugar fermentation stimulation protein A
MKYRKIENGIFLARPNRFVAHVLIHGEEHIVHVKNTGRCREILQPGVRVHLEDYEGDIRNRKTRYSLVAAEKPDEEAEAGHRLINIDSQAPNKAVGEALASGIIQLPGFEDGLFLIKPEQCFGSSRFDFYIEGHKGQKAFIEVKGVTLEDRGIVRFPDAPTIRGVKHIHELVKAVEQGYKAFVIFVIQMQDVRYFEPNDETHAAFGQALRVAARKGVLSLAYDCRVTKSTMKICKAVPVFLDRP